MANDPGSRTIGTAHTRTAAALLDGLKKVVEEAEKKNGKDPNAVKLRDSYGKLAKSVKDLKEETTTIEVYDDLKKRMTTAATEFPKLAKAVKNPVEEKVKVNIVVAYSNDKVKKACAADSNCKSRINEVVAHGHPYVGHKAVSAIKAQGHVHVGNSNAIAFSWKSESELKIVGYGTKSNSAKPGNSGYEWIV